MIILGNEKFRVDLPLSTQMKVAIKLLFHRLTFEEFKRLTKTSWPYEHQSWLEKRFGITQSPIHLLFYPLIFRFICPLIRELAKDSIEKQKGEAT